MDVDAELRKLLRTVDDPTQRQRTLDLWHRIKGKLSDRQRLAILRAWNTYLVDSNISLFDQTIEEVIEELESGTEKELPRKPVAGDVC